ncbi:flagellar export protein FliJ [Notoacmeibacter sp. MSK16QG-6]|uniref:flagellar export protein FliJ n=1 Tax=Notoacmeibacter sp. MSK16QG-6 TaxID=2957982 RepID=UPI00209C9A08|nr:flagellar export protein FliJ [Notoacmeibacter sp. MSK16QG-6]MCP1199922.1 flagellar export protein FliJ [Notoacmeibacter sp. MSK16QG-6]
MKSRDNLVRLNQFHVNEKRRQLDQLETMMAEFTRKAAELELQIESEEKKANITDVDHFAYPTFAKAARVRRENLLTSQAELKIQRDAAEAALAEAEAELSRAEMLDAREARVRPVEAVDRRHMIG